MIWVVIFATLLIYAGMRCQRRPGIAIGLLITMYGIETFLQSQSTYIIDHGSYANIAVGLIVFIAVAFSLGRRPIKSYEFNSVQLLTYAIFGLGFLSFYWSLAPEQLSRWKGELPHIMTYTVLAPILIREKNVLSDGFRWALLIGVPVMILTAFYADWGGRGLLLAKPIMMGGRVTTEAQPLTIASLASALGIIALVIDLKKMPFKFAFRLAVLALALYIAFRTESRGQVVAILTVSAIIYPISNRATNAKGLFFTVTGFAAFGGIFYYLIKNLKLARWGGRHVEEAITGRQEMWFELISYWGDNPGLSWFIGLGACSSFDIVGFYPHNLPIEILAELGLVGISIFIAILLISFKNSLKLLSKLGSDQKVRGDSVAIIGLIGVNLALCMKEGSLYGWSPLFMYAICLAQQVRLAKQTSSSRGVWGMFIQPKQQSNQLPYPGFQNQRSY